MENFPVLGITFVLGNMQRVISFFLFNRWMGYLLTCFIFRICSSYLLSAEILQYHNIVPFLLLFWNQKCKWHLKKLVPYTSLKLVAEKKNKYAGLLQKVMVPLCVYFCCSVLYHFCESYLFDLNITLLWIVYCEEFVFVTVVFPNPEPESTKSHVSMSFQFVADGEYQVGQHFFKVAGTFSKIEGVACRSGLFEVGGTFSKIKGGQKDYTDVVNNKSSTNLKICLNAKLFTFQRKFSTYLTYVLLKTRT